MENFTHNNSIFKTKIGYKIRFIIFTGIFLFVNLILTAQIVPTIQPYGGFEIDGDLKANTPTNGIGDWLSNTGSGGYLLNNNGTPLDPFNTLYIIDDFNGNDDIYQSSKFNENPNTWVWTTGAASNKNDINKTLFHLATDVNNNTWLIVASDRLSTSGTSYIDFEFLQNTLAKNQNGTFTSFGPHNGRTVNDFVISMEYSNGGSSGIVRFYTWKLVNSVYKYIEVTVPSNIAFAKTNLNTIPVDFGAFGSNQYVPYQFVEAAINITALFGTFDPCLGLNIKTIMVKTKASTSETASLGDFVNPIQTQLNINSATISYANNLCNTGTASVNINGVQGGTFSAVPNNLIINPVTGEIDLTNSAPGSYTITYTYTTNNCNKTTSANVTINPLPTAPTSITASDNNICQTYNQPITLTANGGSGTTLAWYLGSCGDTLIGTGNSITISPPTSTTTYYVRWENSCGVSACLSLTLNVFNSLTVNVISSPQVSCYSGNDGQIIVSVNGGTSPFVYSLNGGTAQSSNTFSGLTAGTYTVVVSDANGCSYTLNNIIIANPTQLTATANASSQVSCNNAADGYITINAQGGTGAYSYSLNGGTAQSSNTFSGLTAGTYTVVVSDANGCSYTLNNILISNPSQLTATANASSQVSCNNAADGYITITAQGGTGAYSYSLNGGTAQNSNTFTGLTAGTYTVVVSDANGCSYTLNNILISNPSQLTATANASSQVSCNNAADGYITITAQGGTGAYSYSLNGSTAQSSNTFNGLTAGTYTVVVSDANGCSYTLNNIIIANPDQLTATANASSQVSCNNAADGQITITAQGGTGAYSYSLNGGTAQSSNTFSGLTAGTYSVVVSDANGCSFNVSNIIIANPAQLTATANASSQVSCNNAADGYITITAQGGTGAYSYNLNGGTAQSSNTFSGLTAGTYSVVVSDANGCSYTLNNILISNPSQLTATANVSSQVSCNNAADGYITITAQGGTGAYSYSINGGTAQSSNTFNGLTAGTYSVVVSDANGCSYTLNNILISNPSQLTATANVSSQVSCNNAADGYITITAQGGTGAYSYSLNGGTAQSSNTFSGLTAGTYSVVVSDANGCSYNLNNIQISNPSQLTATANASSQVSCNNSADGYITITAQGGTGAYSYSLNGGTAQSSNTFSGLTAGTYSVVVSDANGCSYTLNNILISNPSQLTATANASSQVSCNNAADGQITITAQGGTGAYSYSLNGGTAQSSNTFSGLTAGTYSVVVSDANGCSFNVSNIIIANPAQLTATANASSQVSCNNAADGYITITAQGGTGAYSYSLNGGTAQSSNTFNGLTAGTYTVVVSDANGCSYTLNNILISNPSQLTATANASSQVSCNNAADGYITITAQGGTGAYSYSLNGGTAQNSNTFTGLTAGTYTVVVTDANGCSFNVSNIIIANPAQLTATANASSQVSCNNAADGYITITAQGGTGAYSYSLNGGTAQSSNTFSGLTAGTYTVVVSDANGCSYTLNNIIIANPAQLTATANASSQVSCNNAADGYITITAQGGTGAYSYSLNSGTAQNSNTFTGLTAGTYTVVVSDANGCSYTLNNILISNPSQLTATANASSQVSCNNAADGYITITTQGGTGAYSYSLNGGTAQSSNTFNGLTAGTYTVVVSDANGCSYTLNNIIIANPAQLTATANASSQVSCNNAADGYITITAQGGTGAYSYSINGGTVQSSNTFSGLTAGNYSIVVTDANGCSFNVSNIIIANPAQLTATANASSQVSCNNAADGYITITTQGGTGAYSYSLNGGTAQSSNTFNGLTAGTYTVVVSDANGCSYTLNNIIIANPAQLTATANASSQVSCNNAADGYITITAQGGTGAYSYSLNGGTAQNSNTFTGLTAGTYTVVVSDANGCSFNVSNIIIANPAQLTATANASSQVSCNNAADGYITITAQGGTGAYSYSLNGGTAQSSNTFTGLTAGTFTVVVSDANGCSFNVSNIIIANPSQLTATANASSQVSCNNAADGYITINAQGGTGAYSYSLNGGTAQSSNTFSGLTAGTYSVVVSDANGCSYTLNNILISNPSQLTATANASSQVSCNNAADGYITITAQGGTGAYSYSLNGGTAQSSNTFTGLTAGTFTVVVSDANGCSFNVSNIIIANPSQLTATANVSSQVSCNNAADGYITITAQGGTGAYSYSLNGGAAQSSNTFSGLTAGTYSVVVSDANGCSNQIFVNLNNPEPLNVTYHTYCKTGHVGIEILANGGNGVYQYSINGGSTYSSEHIFDNLPINDTLQLVVTDGNNCMSATYEVPVVNLNTLSANVSILNQNLCFNSNDASVAINAQGGVPPYSYYLNNQPLNNNIVSQLSSGNYEVYIHDSNGCPFYTSFEITQATPISVEIVNMVNPDCYLNSYGQAQISVQGGTPPYQITWSNGDSGFESNLLSPGINQIWVKDLNGCEIEKSLNVQMNTVVVLPSINNVFTPNGDGINETWEIDNLEQFKENELFIYNRWGNEVYTTKNYSNNWNGSDLNEGTYFYILKLKVCDEWQEYSGYITILR